MSFPISPMSVSLIAGEVTAPCTFNAELKVRTYRHMPYACSVTSQDGSETVSQHSGSATPRSQPDNSFNSFSASTCIISRSRQSSAASCGGNVSPPPQFDFASPPAPQQQQQQQPPQQQQQPPQQPQQQQQKKQQPSTTIIVVSHDEFTRNIGSFRRLAFTASGSSLIQAALRQLGTVAYDAVSAELGGYMEQMLVDNHACYVAKLLIEKMPARSQSALLADLASNEAVWVTMCTRSLHSRRMVQFFLDSFDIDQCAFLVLLVQRNFHSIAMSKEGCVTIQRVLDCCSSSIREAFFSYIRANFVAYTCDPHATYVVQYMMRFGEKEAAIDGIVAQLRGNMAALCGNKYASPVLEKCIATFGRRFHAATADIVFQSTSDDVLTAMLNDNYANYVVQALIDHCDSRALHATMAERITSVLPRVQYGRKLLLRINKMMI